MDRAESELWLSTEYLAQGNSNKALTVLDNIPINYTLSTIELADWTAYRAVSIVLMNKDIYQLDPVTLEVLETYENTGIYTKRWVRNILELYGKTYPLEYVISKAKSRSEKGDEEQFIKDRKALEVYPNPAADLVIFNARGLETALNYTVVLSDLNGRIIMKAPLSADVPLLKIETRFLSKGIYFYHFYNTSTELVESGKLIIQ